MTVLQPETITTLFTLISVLLHYDTKSMLERHSSRSIPIKRLCSRNTYFPASGTSSSIPPTFFAYPTYFSNGEAANTIILAPSSETPPPPQSVARLRLFSLFCIALIKVTYLIANRLRVENRSSALNPDIRFVNYPFEACNYFTHAFILKRRQLLPFSALHWCLHKFP